MTEANRSTVTFSGDILFEMNCAVEFEKKKPLINRRFSNRSELAHYAVTRLLGVEQMLHKNPNLKASCAVCMTQVSLSEGEESPLGVVCPACAAVLSEKQGALTSG